jgi:hypothetical protein
MRSADEQLPLSIDQLLRNRGKSDMEENIIINADVVNAPANGASADIAEGSDTAPDTTTTLIKDISTSKPKRSFFDFIKLCFRAYGASLAGSIWVVPIGTSAVTLGLYLSSPLPIFAQPAPNWYPVVFGALFSCVVYLIVALFLCYFTTAEGSNQGSYDLLTSRLCQLKARLSIIDSPDAEGKPKKFAEYQRVALQEAKDNLVDLNSYFYRYPAGLQWVLGLGYVNAWGKVHRAEEALIEVEPIEMVIRGAMHDKLSIQDSKLSNRDELLKKLRQAIRELNPAMERQFKMYRPEEDNEEIHKLKHDLREIAIKVQIDLDGDLANKSDSNQVISPEAEARARMTVREVRRTLNEFRDRLWEGLVRARNHLFATILATGFVTYALLCVAIMSSVTISTNRNEILAATVFYIVGAIMGLFRRFYLESQISTAVDDYGLSLARLIATPLLSGLAGVGGVLLFSALVFESITFSASNIFRLDRPDYIIAAAFFGLTPNLIIRGLQQRSEKYISALKSSKGAVEETSDNVN